MDREPFATGQVIPLHGRADLSCTAAPKEVSVVVLTLVGRVSGPGNILRLFSKVLRFDPSARRSPLH